VIDPAESQRFERLALPHLDAAYNLARWLTRNDHDAQDVVQEATLRALRYFAAFRGDNARPWLLQIVRHTGFAWLRQHRPAETRSLDDDEDGEDFEPAAPASDQPDEAALRKDERAEVNRALASLPVHYREVLVLRELEDLPYRDIAAITEVPVGTVMSRLARARQQMRQALLADARAPLRAVPRAAHGSRQP
jgi:RNA polymerase sigma-70 factor (ECF subfamily)